MSEVKPPQFPALVPEEVKDNVVHLDSKRLDRLKGANYFAIVDEAELLRMKFQTGKIDNAHDAYRFVTLVKYIMTYGHSEALKFSYKLIYDQFMSGL